ncbi:MAG: zf-HC2 domain-containing protein [Planctomycetota bacterium]|nr:zf-HC2 domain-containing protein [Planctomycetota bacterium]
MHCDRAQALMDRYVNEGFPPDERESFEIHLRGCPDCQQQLAKLQRLLAVLRSVPSPPVPQGFVDRVMVRARHEIQASQSSPGFQSAPGFQPALRRWWEQLGSARLANAVGAVAAGLLIGLVLGQQTWRYAASTGRPDRTMAGIDAETAYSLDYLSGSPHGSFTETYLSLTSVASDKES